jgi:hypothetical protein
VGGGKRRTDMRAVVNGLMYILSTGCQWRYLPKDFPPHSTVYNYFVWWQCDRVLDRIHPAHNSLVVIRGPRGSPAAAASSRCPLPRTTSAGLSDAQLPTLPSCSTRLSATKREREQQEIHAGGSHCQKREDRGDRGCGQYSEHKCDDRGKACLRTCVDDHVGRNAENRTMSQRSATRKTGQDIYRHREDWGAVRIIETPG